jgi:hypothetical protein
LIRREIMKKYVLLGLVLLALISMPRTSSANLIGVGDPLEDGSWGQRFEESGAGFFDRMEIINNFGPDFESPAFRNFSQSGWQFDYDYALHASVLGPSTNSMQFDIYFIGNTAPVSFFFLAWNGETLAEAALATYNRGWSFRLASPDEVNSRRTAVPEPTTMFLFGSGLVGFVVLRKKFGR